MVGSESRIARDLASQVENELARVGMLCRVFHRAKTQKSVEEKVEKKGYIREGNLLQDLIGLRVTVYFVDDLEVCRDILVARHELLDETVDHPGSATFEPTRWNLVFRLPEHLWDQVPDATKALPVDSSFEVQLRTVFAEGWHEVEHDLRYKFPADWNDNDDLSRTLNGLVATLETCDWSIIQLLDTLAWRHYRAKRWLPMLRSKYRIRMGKEPIADALVQLFDNENDLAKRFYRADRFGLLRELSSRRVALPLTATNVLLAVNHYFIRDERINAMTPEDIVTALEGA